MKNLLFTLALLISFVSFSQKEGNNFDAISLCFEQRNFSQKSFSSNIEAKKALTEILNSVNISEDYFLQECKTSNNATASKYKGIPYIHYDPEWLKTYKQNKWLNIFILAHEVGHHYFLHPTNIEDLSNPPTLEFQSEQEVLRYFKESRDDEAKADEFAAIVSARLGASLNDIENSGIKDMFYEGSETFEPHPNKQNRINAIRVGYSKRNIELINTSESDKFYISSVKKYFNNDIDGSFEDFKKFKSDKLTEKEISKEFNSMVIDFYKPEFKGRCNATTKAKSQCKRTAQINTSFCWQHNDNNLSDALIGRCEGITKSGNQCKRKASDGKIVCWQH